MITPIDRIVNNIIKSVKIKNNIYYYFKKNFSGNL